MEKNYGIFEYNYNPIASKKKILKKTQQMACSPFDIQTIWKKYIKYLNIHARQMKLQTHSKVRESLRKPASLQRMFEKM
jgi:hypothetical protein